MTGTRGLMAPLLLAMLACGPVCAAAAPAQAQTHALLDVPFVAQPPALCGGAAVAMVLRYWGAREVFPEDFAALVRDGGILTGTLRAAVTGRGWQAHVLTETGAAASQMRAEVDLGRPLIALVEVSPGTYHYVVVVGATEEAVVVHDPAVAPFRVWRWTEFDRAWSAAGRWAMRVLPPGGVRLPGTAQPPPAPPGATGLAAETPCTALVAQSVRDALAGDGDGAGRGLDAAIRLCPTDASPLLEMAGLRFSQQRWPEAETLARASLRLAPGDGQAWALLAVSQYLTGDTVEALAAWNHVDEPRVDLITVYGAVRTRHPAVVRTLGLEPRSLLTPARYARARRQLLALPAASGARIRYEPLEGGQARVDAFIDERPALPSGWGTLAVLGGGALVLREAGMDVPGGLGAGERAQVFWRWAARRPRVAVELALPSMFGPPGVVSIEGAWERQTYASGSEPGATPVREERRRVVLHMADWSTGWLRWQAGAGLDGWRAPGLRSVGAASSREHFAVSGGLDVRLAGDRLALRASHEWWIPLNGGNRFSTAGLQAAWRSTVDPVRPVWALDAFMRGASRLAPLGTWPGAGTGQARSGMLRAHPLLSDGVLDGTAFGRIVPSGSLSYARPVRRVRLPGLMLAGFVDVARAWDRPTGAGASRLLVDAGAGVRLRAPGGGAVRVDLARGVRGGGTVLSAGWDETWPR